MSLLNLLVIASAAAVTAIMCFLFILPLWRPAHEKAAKERELFYIKVTKEYLQNCSPEELAECVRDGKINYCLVYNKHLDFACRKAALESLPRPTDPAQGALAAAMQNDTRPRDPGQLRNAMGVPLSLYYNRTNSFDDCLKRAQKALEVVGTGKLASRPLVREGARSYEMTEAEVRGRGIGETRFVNCKVIQVPTPHISPLKIK